VIRAHGQLSRPRPKVLPRRARPAARRPSRRPRRIPVPTAIGAARPVARSGTPPVVTPCAADCGG